MPQTPFQVEYNTELSGLSELLGQVDRAGSFMVAGARVGALPRVDIDGLGTLAFPLPDAQARELAGVAEAAPYGRGEDTVYDASVRRTRQVSPDRVRVGGATWADTLRKILASVRTGLGCEGIEVEAQLHKLLLYETGDFFAPHRDTEKAGGMFGTLVVTLPSFHEGGDLIVRHRDHEERVSLAPRDVSEIRYAAFYADCVHEVLPVEKGNRLCLIYNLVHVSKSGTPLEEPVAPDYDQVVGEVAAELERWKSLEESATKAAWLLDHAYTPAGLSFAGLKHVDAARAGVLLKAAERAGCVLYLGIVQLEECGPAEIEYGGDYGYGGYHGEPDEEEEDEDFEVIEISDWNHRITDWVTPGDESVDFGEMPLMEGELLPAGALDGEEPDEQRATEATGNEGASFERSYRRAALIFWDRDRTAEVLLQSGTAAAAAHFVHAMSKADLENAADRARMKTFAKATVQHWLSASEWNWQRPQQRTGLAEMLGALGRLGDARLAKAFIKDVVVESFESGINQHLVTCLRLSSAKTRSTLACQVMRENAEACPADCIDLLSRMVAAEEDDAVQRSMAGELIAAMPRRKRDRDERYWSPGPEGKPTALSGEHLADLFDALRRIGSEPLTEHAVKLVADHPEAYPPDELVVAALKEEQKRQRRDLRGDTAYAGLWQAAASFLLQRSSRPPPKPSNWTLPVRQGCTCADCRALMSFAADPDERKQRFPLRKDRRQHLHRRIDGDGMDMTHVTERSGRPYTLVCTKTRRTYKRRLKEYGRDVASMTFLEKHAPVGTDATTSELARAISLA